MTDDKPWHHWEYRGFRWVRDSIDPNTREITIKTMFDFDWFIGSAYFTNGVIGIRRSVESLANANAQQDRRFLAIEKRRWMVQIDSAIEEYTHKH